MCRPLKHSIATFAHQRVAASSSPAFERRTFKMQGSAARPRRDVPVVSRKSLPWEIDRESHTGSDIPKPASRPSSYGSLATPASQYESTINRVQSMMNRVESTYSAPYSQESRNGAPTRQVSSAVDLSRMQGGAPSGLPPRMASGGYGDSHRRSDAPSSASYMTSAPQYTAPAPRVRNMSLDEPSYSGMPAKARVTPEDADSVFYSSLRGGQADKPGFKFDAQPSKSSFDDVVPRRPRPLSGQNGVPVANSGVAKRSAAPSLPDHASSSLQYDRQYSKPSNQQQQPFAASGYAASTSRELQQAPSSQPPSSELDLLQPRRRVPAATVTRKDAEHATHKPGPSFTSQQQSFLDSSSSSRQQHPASSKVSDAYGSSNLNHAASVTQRGGTISAPMDERPSGNTELFPCPDCGRSFISSALERHAKICQSVFKGKKKPTDTDPYATGSSTSYPTQQQPVASSSGKTGSRQPASVAQSQRETYDRWDAPSQSRAPTSAHTTTYDSHAPSKGIQKPQASSDDRQPQPQPNYPAASSSTFSVPEYPPGDQNADADSGPLEECPDCGRKFNSKAFEKHVKICQKVRCVLLQHLLLLHTF